MLPRILRQNYISAPAAFRRGQQAMRQEAYPIPDKKNFMAELMEMLPGHYDIPQ